MTDSFIVTGARIDHHGAPLSALERASHVDPPERLGALLDRDAVDEAFVLQTCNRVEEYVVAPTEAAGRDALSDFAAGVTEEAVVRMDHRESLRHLLRVASGLESQVLGEDQILGQVRSAYATACSEDAIGRVLERGLLKAIHVGERARAETAINEGTVSLGSAAVDLVSRELGLAGRRVAIVGAGETARTVAEALAAHDLEAVCVLNRTVENAARLARGLPVPATAAPLDALARHLPDADVVITATGSDEPVLRPETVAEAGDLLAIDLAQPRDVSPGVVAVPGVAVRDLDALHAITDETHERRAAAAVAVERIVEEEFDRLLADFKRKRADAVIAAMYEGAERIKQRELEEALARLEGGEADEAAVVEGLANAIVSRLMAVPTESLRDAAEDDDWETITTAIQLFDPGIVEGRSEELLSVVPSLAAEDLAVEATGDSSEDD